MPPAAAPQLAPWHALTDDEPERLDDLDRRYGRSSRAGRPLLHSTDHPCRRHANGRLARRMRKADDQAGFGPPPPGLTIRTFACTALAFPATARERLVGRAQVRSTATPS